MHLKTAVLFVMTLTGCAGIDAAPAEIAAGAEEQAGLFGNGGFAEDADAEHVLVLDGSEPETGVGFRIVGRERHRMVLDVRGEQQRLHLVLDAPRTEDGRFMLHRVTFHGEDWRDTPPVEMRIARELSSGNAVDVVLAPGTYAFDLESYRAASEDVHPVEIEVGVTPAGDAATFDEAALRGVGDWLSGDLAFGESALFQLEGSQALGLAAASRDLASVCSRTWIASGSGIRLDSTSTQTWRSLTSVASDERLYVELIGCKPGSSGYDHLVIDADDYEAL